MPSLYDINHWLFFAINNGLKSPIGDLFLGYTTYLGDGVILYPLSLIGLFFLDKKNFWINLRYFLIIAILSGVIIQLMKNYFNAPRPLLYFEEEIKNQIVIINVMFEPLMHRSFPSGHAQSAFTFASTFSWLFGRSIVISRNRVFLQIMVYTLATLTSLSRIYVGVHFPVDILAGAILGYVISQVMFKVISQYEKKNIQPSS